MDSKLTNRRTRSDWSTHLAERDRQVLEAHLFEEKSVSLATTLAEVYITLPNNQKRWHKIDHGVLCFVKDYDFRAYFFRLYSLDFCLNTVTPEMLWEQQVTFPLSYNKVTSKFHYFSTDFGYVSFNFTYEDEAAKTLKVITDKINVKRYKNLKRQQSEQSAPTSPSSRPLDSLNRTAMSASSIATRPAPDTSTGTPLLRVKKALSRTLSNSNVLGFIRSKVGRGKFSIDKTKIGSPTEPRLVKHGILGSDEYEERFKNILVELNMSFRERSMVGSQFGETTTINRAEESLIDLNTSMTKPKASDGAKRFAPPPPPRPADPSDLAVYLGKRASQATFPPPVLTPPVSPVALEDEKPRKSNYDSLSRCTLSPIERNSCLIEIPVTPSDELAISEVKNQRPEDFNAKIGFKGFTNKVHVTPRLRSLNNEPSFVSPNFPAPGDPFIMDTLRSELIRQAPHLTCNSDDE